MTSPTSDRRQGLVGNTPFKAPVDCATSTPITLSGERVVDGVQTNASRCLVFGQADATTNGIYDTSTAAWTRSADADGNYDMTTGTLVYVAGGTSFGGLVYACTSAKPITFGSSAITFALAGNLGNFGATLGLTINTIAVLRTIAKTGISKAFVLGYYASGDGGGGQYYYDSTDTTSADNGGSIIVAADGGRWKLVNLGQFSVKQFGAKGDGVNDDTTAMQAALTVAQAVGGRVTVPQTAASYLTSASLNVGVNGASGTTVYQGVELIGLGMPLIKSNNNAVPIINFGGVNCRLEGLQLQYTAKPANTFTNAVAIRTYNVAYSIIERIYAFNVFGVMDMFQGAVAGTSANFFFSNSVRDILCQQYSGWGIKMLPFVGGNSGSVWSNIYLNANNNTGAAGSSATLGGFWLQTCQNEVIDLLNVEWQRNAGSAIVLNQCHNVTFRAIHFEGLYPTTAFSPLIDIVGGDGSCPTFGSITVTGNDWTGYAAINQGALFRLDALGTRAVAQSVTSYNNTNPTFMSALFNAGVTCYGSTLEVVNVTDLDLSLSSDAYSPRVSAGTATTNVEYPMQRWNLNIAKHSSLAADNAGGTNNTVAAIPGAVTSPAFDGMGLWDTTNKQFVVKQSGAYQVQVLVPTAASPIFQVKQNGTTIAGLTPPTAGGHDSVTYPFVRGDIIKITLASGSYTRTAVTFGISLAS